MARIIADISDYDPDYAADDYSAGIIINVEAKSLIDKAELAHAAGVPIHLYSWVYPGDNGYSVTRSYAAAELLRLHNIHVVHHWLDYEEKGVGPQNLVQAGQLLDANEAPVGTYTYLSVLPQVRTVLVGVLWLAYYPHGYDYVDYYDAMSNSAREEGAVMHQFTSVAPPDGRDLSAVLADRWYDAVLAFSPSAPAPTEGPRPVEEVEMRIYHNTETAKDPDAHTATGEWVAFYGSDGPVNITAATAYGSALKGVPWWDNYNTLGIIGEAVTMVTARKSSDFWDKAVAENEDKNEAKKAAPK